MRIFLSYICALCCAFYCGLSAADIVVSDARIKQVLPGRTTTAAYMVVHNAGGSDAVLFDAHLALASSIEMHEIVKTDGLSGMRRRSQVVLPVGKSVAFKTGGLHLMIFGVQQKLPNQVDIELIFDDGTTQITRFKTEVW